MGKIANRGAAPVNLKGGWIIVPFSRGVLTRQVIGREEEEEEREEEEYEWEWEEEEEVEVEEEEVEEWEWERIEDLQNDVAIICWYAGIFNDASGVGTQTCCSPRRPTYFEPSPIDFNGIL